MKKNNNQSDEFEPAWYEKKQGITRRKKIKSAEYEEIKQLKKEGKDYFQKKSKQDKESAKERKKNNSLETKKARSRMEEITVEEVDSLFDIANLPSDARNILQEVGNIISEVSPLNSKQRLLLPKQIQALSHSLTDERDKRWTGYMNKTETLSAYVRYFFWWNLVRLTRLFSNLPSSFFSLSDGDICLDIGSGPLTLPIALFLARPELRTKDLTFYCMDISSQALLFGENIFLSIASKLKCQAWKIVRVKGSMGTAVKEKAVLVTCANMFNEATQDSSMPPDYLAKKYCEQLLSYTDEKKDGKVLVVETGAPKAARFVSLLRDSFLRRGYQPLSPCTHCSACPMDGKKGGKWCNYVFSTDDAPKELKKLSAEAKLTKERAVLSFVALTKGMKKEEKEGFVTFRIASDGIHLPGNRTGHYACSPLGLLLVVSNAPFSSGECLCAPLPKVPLPVDEKSGAFILKL